MLLYIYIISFNVVYVYVILYSLYVVPLEPPGPSPFWMPLYRFVKWFQDVPRVIGGDQLFQHLSTMKMHENARSENSDDSEHSKEQ